MAILTPRCCKNRRGNSKNNFYNRKKIWPKGRLTTGATYKEPLSQVFIRDPWLVKFPDLFIREPWLVNFPDLFTREPWLVKLPDQSTRQPWLLN